MAAAEPKPKTLPSSASPGAPVAAPQQEREPRESTTPRTKESASRARGGRLSNVVGGFVGACALAVSAYTAILQRQQVRAQIWPVVTWDTDTDLADDSTNERFAVRLTNSGVGPAFIKWAALTVDGSPVATWTDLIERFHGKKGFSAHLSRTALTNLVLGAGQDHRVFAVDGVVASEIAPAALRLQFSVCYCSVLEECWQVDSAQATPQAVRACAKPPVPFIGE